MGACGYGRLDPPSAFGPNAVAALSDVSPYFPGSCGRCFEVRCRPATVTSGSGVSYDRTAACRPGNGTIIVQVIDECTSVGNTEWCADPSIPHLDLGKDAFRRLANPNVGFIGLLLRPVPCAAARRGGIATPEQYDRLHEEVALGASRTVFGGGALGLGWSKIVFGDVKETASTANNNLETLDDGTVALCNAFRPGGGLIFQAAPPAGLRVSTFEYAAGVEFYLRAEDGTLPGALVTLGSDQRGTCGQGVAVAQGATGTVDGWRRFFFPLAAFACPDSISVGDLNRILIQNQGQDAVGFCLKELSVVPGGEGQRTSSFEMAVSGV